MKRSKFLGVLAAMVAAPFVAIAGKKKIKKEWDYLHYNAEPQELKWVKEFWVAPEGDDNNPGTEAKPFRSLTYAAKVGWRPGTKIYIAEGVYNEVVEIPSGLSVQGTRPWIVTNGPLKLRGEG